MSTTKKKTATKRRNAILSSKERNLIKKIWPDFDKSKLWIWGENNPGFAAMPRSNGMAPPLDKLFGFSSRSA